MMKFCRIYQRACKTVSLRLFCVAAVLGWQLLNPSAAAATQGHGGIEGVYVHQMAHLLFLLSMVILIFRLRRNGLTGQKGWRLIQYAALFFILWNIDAMAVHLLDDQFKVIQARTMGPWMMRITSLPPSTGLQMFYYVARLDHFLCVPAMFFLYTGLKQLLQAAGSNPPGPPNP